MPAGHGAAAVSAPLAAGKLVLSLSKQMANVAAGFVHQQQVFVCECVCLCAAADACMCCVMQQRIRVPFSNDPATSASLVCLLRGCANAATAASNRQCTSL